MRRLIILTLLTALCTPVNNRSNRPDFLGFQVGCTKQEWQEAMQAIWANGVGTIDSLPNGLPCGVKITYLENHRLSGAYKTYFTFMADMLVNVQVVFLVMDEQEAEELAATLVRMVEEKYGRNMRQDIWEEGEWSTIIGSIDIAVFLERRSDWIHPKHPHERASFVQVSAADLEGLRRLRICRENAQEKGLGEF